MNTSIKFTPLIFCLIVVFSLGTLACYDPIPCPDCDNSVDDMEGEPMPDLPCGGADLMTDPLNCGSCGNVCQIFPGTEWAVGECEGGVCVGPGWNDCAPEGFGATCESRCAASNGNCVAAGCGGYTAMLLHLFGDFDPSCSEPDPYATMQGACDELIPFADDGTTYAMCCCEWP